MISRALLAFFLFSGATLVAGTDDTGPSKSTRELLKERLAEQAKHAGPVGEPVTDTAKKLAAQEAEKAEPQPDKSADAKATAATHAQPATVLPQVEVRRNRITKLDQALAKEDQLIAREKKNTQPSEVDKALNDQKIAKPLSIFGGESTQFRQHVASERVSLMEDEKDLLEAIAHAKTKAEKAELQKQLDALREERRQLEQALR